MLAGREDRVPAKDELIRLSADSLSAIIIARKQWRHSSRGLEKNNCQPCPKILYLGTQLSLKIRRKYSGFVWGMERLKS